MSGKLTLVGAGPGDPELITLKGVKAIADAQVVLYDALVHTDILKFVYHKAEKIFVGKRSGVCQFKQEDINSLIVENALAGKKVVRIKGGDPFVFGRGHEELMHAKSFGIPVEIVPGVSSAYSVPELQEIPLTRRGINESFWVVTGTTRDHMLSNDVRIAAQSTATVVILMGMKKLPEIVSIFNSEGKGDLPVAIIQEGSTEKEKKAIATVNTIQQIVHEQGLGSPAVIVLGEVVKLHPEWTEELVGEFVSRT